jgi:hypothetical protein
MQMSLGMGESALEWQGKAADLPMQWACGLTIHLALLQLALCQAPPLHQETGKPCSMLPIYDKHTA